MSGTAPLPFEEVFREMVDQAGSELAASPSLSSAACSQLNDDLLRLLSQICSWPLLAAFAVFRDADARRFQSAEAEIYRDFSRRLLGRSLADFLGQFPELSRLIAACVANWSAANREFLSRLEGNQSALASTFSSATTGPLRNLEPALSDRHGGRTVMGVTFESGLKLAYKPRDMTLERSYFCLLDWLNSEGAPVDQRVLRVLERPGYGWAEWIEQQPCRDEDDVRDYFTRAGALQCLFYIFHATDAHMGNVLAAGSYPVMVDAECLLQPRRFAGAADLEQEALEDLLNAAFLPRPKLVRGDAPDFSGLGGDSGCPTEFRIPEWQNVNTDAMSLRFVTGFLVSQPNAPVLHGLRAEMRNYSAEFLAGFENMYCFLADRRQRLLAPNGPLESMFSSKTRVLLRGTRACVAVMNRSLHPRYLRDAGRRALMLRAWVRSRPLDLTPEALDVEANILGSLNIPYFKADPNDVTLEVEGGVSIPGYFHVSGRQMIAARLQEMDAHHLQKQMGLLGSLLTLSSLPDLAKNT